MDKIICLGKNYSDHIKEMKEASPERPLLFIKPPSSLVEIKDNAKIVLPWERGTIHHECEIVFKLYKKNIIGLALGLDLTLRDIQKKLKELGHPWEIAKTFKNSAIVTPFKSVKDCANWRDEVFTLKVNGEIKQQSSINKAILNPDEIVHHVNNYFTICDGDIIFTGTPSGVGPLAPNDEIELTFGPIHHKFKLVDNG